MRKHLYHIYGYNQAIVLHATNHVILNEKKTKNVVNIKSCALYSPQLFIKTTFPSKSCDIK